MRKTMAEMEEDALHRKTIKEYRKKEVYSCILTEFSQVFHIFSKKEKSENKNISHLPRENSRIEIIKIHASGMAKQGEIDYEAVAKLAEGFNGADLRNICTEAGIIAISDERDFALHADFMNAIRKISEAKHIEKAAHFNAHFGGEQDTQRKGLLKL